MKHMFQYVAKEEGEKGLSTWGQGCNEIVGQRMDEHRDGTHNGTNWHSNDHSADGLDPPRSATIGPRGPLLTLYLQRQGPAGAGRRVNVRQLRVMVGSTVGPK